MKTLTSLLALILMSASLAFAATPPYGVWEWTQTETAPGVFVSALENGNSLQRSFKEDMNFTEYQDEIPVLSGVYWIQEIIVEDTVLNVLTMDFGGISPALSPYLINESGALYMYWGVDSQTGLPSYPVEHFVARAPISTETSTWDGFKALFR
jgi:hypothetical protein